MGFGGYRSFMPSPPCPKCKGQSTHIARARAQYVGQVEDLVFSCITCGKRVYGVEQVKALVAEHEERVQAALAAAREVEERLLAEERRRAAEASIFAAAKCAWPPCPNDHTMSSKYCSRTCNDRNAHHRAKQRKALKKAGTP